jgi:hypothetical protein
VSLKKRSKAYSGYTVTNHITNRGRKEEVVANQEEKRKKDVKIVIKLDIMLQNVQISKGKKTA